MKASRKALIFLFLSTVTAFGLVYLYFWLTDGSGGTEGITRELMGSVIARRALVRSLSVLPSIAIFVTITAFSVLFTLAPFQEEFSYSAVAVPSHLFLLLLIVFIVLSQLLLIPKTNRETEWRIYHANAEERALSLSGRFAREGDPRRAVTVLDTYLEMDRMNETAVKKREEFLEMLRKRSSDFGKTMEEETRGTVQTEAPPTYYERGKAALQREEYHQALYYLERALTLHSDNAELRELYARTEKRVGLLIGSLTENEEEIQSLIQRKGRALAYIEQEDYYAAYEILRELHERYPGLGDLALYLHTVEEELKKTDFLPSEPRKYEWLPSFDSIIFMDGGGYINTVRRLVVWNDTYYFYGVDRYRPDGSKMCSYLYGKYIEGKILLKNDTGFVGPACDESVIVPPVDPAILPFIMDTGTLDDRLTVYERFSLGDKLLSAGVDVEDALVYLSRQLGILFAVYVLSLLLGTIGWAKRSIYEFPPVLKLIIFIVTVPLLSHLLLFLYRGANDLLIYSFRYVQRSVFRNTNVAVFTALVNGIIALAVTFFFLSKSSRID